jgi:hypothetical protein
MIMAPFPLNLTESLGPLGAYLIYLLIGFGFGFVLEQAGFGNSTRLAAQFYFKDLTVLKVMFGAIVVAMILIFFSAGLGLLDFNKLWVNPTYLWPGIVGGLVMGVGFIIGGFCPGTSLVAAATFKLDGVFFALGAFFGIFLFGETVGLFEDFFYSSYYGRLTIPEWLGVDTGAVVMAITLMALAVFVGAEYLERAVGKQTRAFTSPRWRLVAATLTVVLTVAVLLVGQPTRAERWDRMAPEKLALLEARAVQIHPGELLGLMHNGALRTVIFDMRSETDFNRFHLLEAQHATLADLAAQAAYLRTAPPNTVYVLVSNDENAATEAWKLLTAESVPNVYLLEGGLNGWIDTFADAEFKQAHTAIAIVAGLDTLRYTFPEALGDRYPLSFPEPKDFKLEFTSKVKLQISGGPKGGGCG